MDFKGIAASRSLNVKSVQPTSTDSITEVETQHSTFADKGNKTEDVAELINYSKDYNASRTAGTPREGKDDCHPKSRQALENPEWSPDDTVPSDVIDLKKNKEDTKIKDDEGSQISAVINNGVPAPPDLRPPPALPTIPPTLGPKVPLFPSSQIGTLSPPPSMLHALVPSCSYLVDAPQHDGGSISPGPPRAPPPPGGPSPVLPFGMKHKKKYNVEQPMKRANWNKVEARQLDNKSFWVKANEINLESDDEQALQDNFSTKMDTVQVNLAKKGKELKVLDPKTGQNLSILLVSMKVPYEEIKRRLVEMDEENLTPTLLEGLIKYMPDQDTLNQIAIMKDDYDSLAEPEQFCVTISSIKNIVPRLNAMIFKMGFNEKLRDIGHDIVNTREGLEEVKNSDKFGKLLELVLEVGNYLNTGSRNEQSLGFDINFLSKLGNTKANDGKTTLLHFLANIAEKKHPDILNFNDDLRHLDKASRVSDENTKENIKQMEKQFKQLETDLMSLKKTAEDEDRFQDVMNQFVGSAKQQFEVLCTKHGQLESLYEDIGKFYAFDSNKYNMEEFFADIKVFKDGFITAVKENTRIHETEDKIRRATEAKEKSFREKEAKQASLGVGRYKKW